MKLIASFSLVLAGFAILGVPTFGASVPKVTIAPRQVTIDSDVPIDQHLLEIFYQEFDKYQKEHPNEVYDLVKILYPAESVCGIV